MALTEKDTLEYYKEHPEPVIDVKAEIVYSLQQAIKEIEYLQRIMNRQTASGICIVVILKNTLNLVEKELK